MFRTFCRRLAFCLVAAGVVGGFFEPVVAQQAGSHLSFDGVDDYLTVPDEDALSFGNGVADAPLSFEMWLRPESLGAKQTLVGKWFDHPNLEYRLYFAAQTLRLDLRDSSAFATVSAWTPLALTGWHHLAVTYDGRGGPMAADGMTFYVDGVAVPVVREAHPAYVAMENRSVPLQIGREGPAWQQYHGGLDDLRIWNVARTPGQIQAQMATELAGPQPGLVAYWPFNEGAGPTAQDPFAGPQATLVNDPTWTAGGPLTPAAQQAPAIVSATSASFATGAAGTFLVTSTGDPIPSISVLGALPDGVTFVDRGDGTAEMSGTPASGSGGSYPLTLTAANGVGTPATQAFTLTVTQAVAITSAASATFGVGTPGNFLVISSGAPLPTVTSSTLPSGLTLVDNGNGTATLSGTPAAVSAGLHLITITAANGTGTPASQNFALTVTRPAAITSAAAAAFQVGAPGSFLVTSSGYPLPSLAATGTLPNGMLFTDYGNGTGSLAGTPAEGSAGSYSLTLTATNGVGAAANQAFLLTLPDCLLQPPGNGLPAATFQTPYGFALAASGGTGHSFGLTAGSLPSGITLSDAGQLVGVPTSTGTYAFTIAATNSGGCSAAIAYTLNVRPDARDESFDNGVANTQYSVGAGVPLTPAVSVAGTVLSNDQGPGPLTAGPAVIATTNGGQVALSSQGTFLYTPPTGFAGPSDSFTYTLTDGNGVADTAVVTINLGGVVWYVNAASAAGDGRSQSPFNAMAAASAAAQPGQYIYVHAGSPSGAMALKPGQTLWGAGAPFSLNALMIPAATAPILQGTVTLANNVTVRAITVNGGTGPAIAGNGLTGSETLTDVAVTGGIGGLDLVNLSGTLNMTGGGISGLSSGAAVRLLGGSGNVSIGSPITSTSGRSIDIQNRTGGTIAVSSSITDTGGGILLSNNAGTSMVFTGGLALSTGENAAFTATGGGNVTVVQGGASNIVNTIATTTGVALHVSHTEIGAAGVTFRSISAGLSYASPGAGIILDTTGMSASNGGLTVTGAGAPQSGGVIRRKSGPDGSTIQGVGISLNSTKNPSFSWMDLSLFENSAIVGRNVNGLLIANSLIMDAGTAAGLFEGPIVFGVPGPDGVDGLHGTGVIRDTVVVGGVRDNMAFYNRSGALTLRIERTTPSPGDCQIGLNSTATGRHGLVLQIEGTAQTTAVVSRCRFRDNRETGLFATASGDAELTLTVTGPVAESEFVRGSSGQGIDGIVVTNSGNAKITTAIENAVFYGYAGAGIRIGQAEANASATAMLHATISGNLIEAITASSEGISGRFSSTPGEVSQTRLLLTNNHVYQHGAGPGIVMATAGDGATPNVDVTLMSNHVDMMENSPGGSRGPVGMQIEASRGVVCSALTSNISHFYPVGVSPQGGGIRMTQGGVGVLALERGAEALTASPLAVLSAANLAPPLSVMVTEVVGTIAVIENSSCLLPLAPEGGQ